MDAQPNILTMALLASAFKAVHADDTAAQRAADNALTHLRSAPILAFDATELRVLSQQPKKAADGMHYIADAEACTCDGARHPWCKHRAEYRLLLAELALRNPAELLRLVREQSAPADADDAEIAVAPGITAVITAVAGDVSDAEYVEIVAQQEPDGPGEPADAWTQYRRDVEAGRVASWAPDYISELWP